MNNVASTLGSLSRGTTGPPLFWVGPDCISRTAALLLLRYQRPTDNRAADRTPPPERLINQCASLGLLLDGALRFNLWVRHVPHGDPAWGARPHFFGY